MGKSRDEPKLTPSTKRCWRSTTARRLEMTIEVYQYDKCSTCRKALNWLRARGEELRVHDIVTSPPSRARLAELVARSGLPVRRWLNTSGQSYRQPGFKEKIAEMSDAQVLDALSADGKLIKRPVVVSGDVVLVGFDEAAYEAGL
jgi:arsenate reductase